MWTLDDFKQTRWAERNLAAFYMAKHGDDRNDGHPRRPVASLNRAAQLAASADQRVPWGTIYYLRPVVVASGVYTESASLPDILIIGDGFVTFDGGGAAAFCTHNDGRFGTYRITVKNYARLAAQYLDCYAESTIFNSFDYLNGINVMTFRTEKCLMINAPRLVVPFFLHAAIDYNNGTLIGCKLKCVDLRDGYGASQLFRNCYFDENCEVQRPNSSVTYFRFFNCNVRGRIDGEFLAAHEQGGNPATVQCFSTPPGFNNTAAGDYTLAPTSVMRNAAVDGGSIGTYGIGVNFSGLADADVLNNAQWNSSLGAFVIVNAALLGSVEFVVKDFQRNWILNEALIVGEEDNIDNQTIDSTLSYELDGFGQPYNTVSGALEVGVVYWNNGYDEVMYGGQSYLNGQFIACTPGGGSTYTTKGAGKIIKLTEAPNIRLFELKYSVVSAFDCASKAWQYFIFNKVPTIDAAGRSNGDPLYDPRTANPITARWIKLRVSIMPNSLA